MSGLLLHLLKYPHCCPLPRLTSSETSLTNGQQVVAVIRLSGSIYSMGARNGNQILKWCNVSARILQFIHSAETPPLVFHKLQRGWDRGG